MVITCPKCQQKFSLELSALGVKGKTVRCAQCKHTWHQNPKECGLIGNTPIKQRISKIFSTFFQNGKWSAITSLPRNQQVLWAFTSLLLIGTFIGHYFSDTTPSVSQSLLKKNNALSQKSYPVKLEKIHAIKTPEGYIAIVQLCNISSETTYIRAFKVVEVFAVDPQSPHIKNTRILKKQTVNLSLKHKETFQTTLGPFQAAHEKSRVMFAIIF